MRKTFLFGVAAIAVFFATGMTLVWWATRDESPVTEAGAPPLVAAPAVAELPARRPPPEPVAQGSTASIEESARLAKEVNAPPETARGSKAWRPAGTRRPPRGAGNGFAAGLGALQPRLASCGDGKVAPSGSGRAVNQAVLVLDLEPLDGKVRVADASVHSQGRLGDETVACARRVLVGQVLTVPEARPGQHVRVPYPLRF